MPASHLSTAAIVAYSEFQFKLNKANVYNEMFEEGIYVCGIESVLKKIVVIVIKDLLGSRLCDLSIFWPLAPNF